VGEAEMDETFEAMAAHSANQARTALTERRLGKTAYGAAA
jgi:hypothetical protein